MTHAGTLGFVVQSINPIGGTLVSIPLAVFELKWNPWLAWTLGLPLSYVQVIFVDAAWDQLLSWSFFRAQLEKGRSPLAERLMSSKGGFWPTLALAPFIGPWLVMALMRYARVPQRKVALPILLGLAWWSAAVTAACVFVPRLFGR